MSLKARIESILFLTDKPMRAAAIAKIVNMDVQVVRQALLELIQDYESRDGGLEISSDDGYIIQVKDEYSSIIDEFLPMEMSHALIRTLSAIAIKQPIPQSEIIKIRGAGAYDHIKELMEKELINRDESQGGRSPILSTTKKFQEYFRLTKDAKSLRTMLRKQDKPEVTPDGEPIEELDTQQLLLMAQEAMVLASEGAADVVAAESGTEVVSAESATEVATSQGAEVGSEESEVVTEAASEPAEAEPVVADDADDDEAGESDDDDDDDEVASYEPADTKITEPEQENFAPQSMSDNGITSDYSGDTTG